MKKHLLSEGDTFIIRTSRFTCLFTDLLQSVREDFWGLTLTRCVTERKWEKGQQQTFSIMKKTIFSSLKKLGKSYFLMIHILLFLLRDF